MSKLLRIRTQRLTFCTGQTYERANILKWLSMGNRTCPTTMQELWDDVVTPNQILRHLIHIWFSQRYLQIKKRSEDVGGLATELLHSLRRVKGQARVRALKELGKLFSSHPSAAKMVVADAGSGGIPLLSSFLGSFTSHAVGSEVIAILVKLPLNSEGKATLMQPAKISVVVDMLNEGTADTKINCARLVELLMEDNNFCSDC